MAGTKETSVRTYNYYAKTTITNGAYGASFEFVDQLDGTPFISHTLQWCNDGAVSIFFSFDGVTDHGEIFTGEKLTQDFRRQRRIWIRNGGANCPIRFWAW